MTLTEESRGDVNLAELVQPPPEMQKKIRVELNEDPSTRDSDLQHIKEWLALQPHLPPFNDDQRIMTFLRGCKFSLEKTKRKLDMYFTMRAAVPEFFTNRDVTSPELKEILDRVCIPTLPGLTPNGRRVTLLHGKVKDYLTPNVADGMKLLLMIGDIRLYEEQTGVAGDVYILDAAVATPAYFAKFTPSIVKKFLICVQDAYPVKLKEVHVINTHPLVDTIYNFVKPFLKEKIRQRIYFHGNNLESLYKSVPKEILPNEYGGTAGPIEAMHNAWIKKMESYIPWFKEHEKLVADESRRPGKPKNYDDLFGMEGSFKKLNID